MRAYVREDKKKFLRGLLLIGTALFVCGLIFQIAKLNLFPPEKIKNGNAVITPRITHRIDARTNSSTHALLALSSCELLPYEPTQFENSERYRCYAKQLQAIDSASGIQHTVTAFKNYLATPSGTLLQGARCHALSHDIGENAVARGEAPRDILTTCEAWCGFGCLNGAAHANILLTGSVKTAEAFCDSTPTEDATRNGCYHGIGHGVAEYALLDIPKGLALCSNLQSKEAQFQCGHAVIMDVRHVSLPGESTIPAHIASFCKDIPELYRDSCYFFSGFLEYARIRDTARALALCASLDSSYALSCGERVGEALFVAFPPTHAATVASECMRGPTHELARACLRGANRASINGPDGSTGEIALDTCAASDTTFRSPCFTDIGIILEQTYGLAERQRVCHTLASSRDQSSCIRDE